MWVWAYACVWCLSVYCRKMRHGRASQGHHRDRYHPKSVRVRRERSLLCHCKLTFICQGPIHKNISFMIASGTQCNEKWAWQRAPLMKQRETFSHGALLVGLGYPGHSARLCEIWFCIFPAVLLYIILMCLFNWVCLSVHCWCLNEWTSMERDRK